MSKACFALFACMALGTARGADFPEQEPNNTFPPASVLGLLNSGDRVVGSISSGTDVDYHYIKVAGTGTPGLYRYRFQITGVPAGGDSQLTIFDTGNPYNTLVLSDDAEPDVLTSDARYDLWTDGTTTQWGLLVEGYYDTDIWPYQVKVTVTPISAIEAGSFAQGAFAIDTSPTSGIPGQIGDTALTLFNSSHGVVATDDDGGTDWLSKIDLPSGLPPGDYWACVSAFETYFPEADMDRRGVGLGEKDAGKYIVDIHGQQFSGTLAYGDANWYHFTITGPKQVSGIVQLPGYSGDKSNVAIRFDLRQSGTTNVLETHLLALGTDGSYSYNTNLTGMVDVAAKGDIFLRSVLPLDLGGSTSGFDFGLIGGDADGNNAVNIFDISKVLQNYGATGVATPGNVNGDGQVNIFDISLVLQNYGKSGAP